MSQSEARAWWADVEHVRETIEARRRAAELRAADDPRGRDDEPASPAARAVAGHDELAARRRARAGAGRDHDDWLAPDDLLAPQPRRTVQITGRTVPAPPARPLDAPERAGRAPRAFRAPQVLAGPQPDRIAMWAVILGFVLLVAAATSADAHALAAALPQAR